MLGALMGCVWLRPATASDRSTQHGWRSVAFAGRPDGLGCMPSEDVWSRARSFIAGRGWKVLLQAFPGQQQQKTCLPEKAGRLIHSCFLIASVALLVAVGARAAGAQTPTLPQNVLVAAEYCKQASLTRPAFLNLLKTIIKHGDLTDIAFLQKTLGAKFSLSYGFGKDGGPDPRQLIYDSYQVLSNPIHVHLRVVEGSEIQEQGGQIARMQIWGTSMDLNNPNFIRDCLKLSAVDFISSFGSFYDHGLGSAREMLNNPGKDDTKLGIAFFYYSSFDYPTSQGEPVFIDMVQISQWK
jgi:hypothetical protein